MNSKRISEARQEQIFEEVLKREGNNECADCFAKSPAWVSLDFRAVICMNCAGAHRSLGPSITRVRSMKLDAWYEEYFDILAELSNVHANRYYEGKKPHNVTRPEQLASLEERTRWVVQKYVKLLYADKSYKRNEAPRGENLEFGDFLSQETHPKKQSITFHMETNLLDVNEEVVKVIEPNSYIQATSGEDFGPFKGEEVEEEWNDFQGSSNANKPQFDIMSLYSTQQNNITLPPFQTMAFEKPKHEPKKEPKKEHFNQPNIEQIPVKGTNFISAVDFLGEPVKIKQKPGSYW